MKSKLILSLVIGAGALVLAALPVTAAPSPVSDVMTVYSSPGVVSDQRSATEFDETTFPNTLYQIDHNSRNAAMFGSATYITDAVTGKISDIFGVAADGSGNFVLGFMSDDDAAGIDLTIAQNFFGNMSGWINGGVETASPYSMTAYLNPVLQGAGYTATFQSDVDVPDGGMTVTLLGGALVGLQALRRKLKAS